MTDRQDEKLSPAITRKKEDEALSGLFESQGALGLPVAAEYPADLTISETSGRDIAQRLGQSIANLPQDDFMPDQLAKFRVTPEQKKRNILPAVIETLPSQDFLVGIKWQQIKNLPGYAVSGIRKMGRDVFASLDCFNALAQGMDKKDPLGEVLVASDFTHNETAVNFLAGLIEKHGVLLDKGRMDHGAVLPAYSPDIVVMMTQGWTFKLVRDRLENGAPVDLNSIYAWHGGLEHYREQANMLPSPLPIIALD